MKAQRLVAAFAATVATVSLTSCGSLSTRSHPDSELHVALGAQPTTLDEQTGTGSPTKYIMRNVFETLVTTDAHNKVTPMLARKVTRSADGKSYRFDLRRGVRFHNGAEMTSADVVASMNRWLSLYVVAKDVMGKDAKFVADGKYTAELRMSAPAIGALGVMATHKQFPAIMPAGIVAHAAPTGVKKFVGTGPYRFVEWKKDAYVHLTRFDRYSALDTPPSGLAGRREARIRDVYFDIVTDPSTQLAGLQTGKYDILPDASYDTYTWLKNGKDFRVTSFPVGDVVFAFNLRNGAFDTPEKRQAVQIGVDSGDVMDVAFGSKDVYDLKSGYMSVDQPDWYTDTGSDTYDQGRTAEARKRLKAAGYKGEQVTLLTTNDDEYQYKSAVVLQQQLQAMGVNVKLRTGEWATYSALAKDPKNYDIMTAGVTTVSDPTQMSYLGNDWPVYGQSPVVAKNFTAIQRAADLPTAKRVWNRTQKYLREEYVPVVMAGEFKGIAAYNKDVHGFTVKDGPIVWNTTLGDHS